MGGTAPGITRLSRGGFLLPTGRGNIQFGIPPETIKDTMKGPGGVPHTFIVPREMFDLATGVSVADIEFPIYFHFFVRKAKARIVCEPAQRARLEAVLSEALFGPATIDLADEFVEGPDTPGFPDLPAEMGYFRRLPPPANGSLTLDRLVEFVHPDASGVAAFDGFEVRYGPDGSLQVTEAGRELALLCQDDPLIEPRSAPADPGSDFRPPEFGVTTLGAGHGFDPDASTSGIIIWANRRGIVVDPPVGSAETLQRLGVSPKWIDKVILTHCHADHDAGTLQKLLQEEKVNLYTTPTIFRSFLRKSAALTGLAESHLQKLVAFFPVRIGETMMIDEVRFEFHYTLHSIPTIGIQAFLHGKSMIYSSDTMNDPAFIAGLHEQGVLSRQRRDFLTAFPWDRDLVFHEAGVPPLHTPMSFLCRLPREVRERMYLVHVNPAHIPPDSGLRLAPTGLQNTIALVDGQGRHDEAVAIIDAFSHVDLFESLPLPKARELLLIARVRTCQAGEALFHKGDPGDTFLVVMNGAVDIVLDGRVITTYGVGGHFGEKSLFVAESRTAAAVARTAARVLCIDRAEMLSLIRGTESEQLLRQIALYQNVEVRQTLAANPLFRNLTAAQQTRLHGLIQPLDRPVPAGQAIPLEGEAGLLTWLIREGTVDVMVGGTPVAALSRGGLFGVRRLFHGPADPPRIFVARDRVGLYAVDHAGLREYLDRNPGLHIRLFNHPW